MPVGARFSAPVHTGPGAYPVSCTMVTGPSPGEKRPGRGVDHPSPSKCRGQERIGLYLYSPSGSSWPVMGAFYESIEVFYIRKTENEVRKQGETSTSVSAINLF